MSILCTEISENEKVIIHLADLSKITVEFKRARNPSRVKVAIEAPRHLLIEKKYKESFKKSDKYIDSEIE